MAYERILYEIIEGNIARISMNRPEKRNAQDPLMLEELQDAFIEADLDEDVRVVILAATGKDFCSGHDETPNGAEAKGPIVGRAMATKLTGVAAKFKREQYRDLRLGHTLRNISKPSIAMVQGNCFGGGWIVAAMCDLIVCTDDCKFIDPLGSFGIAGNEILFHPYEIGFRRSKEVLWTGDAISAQEAKQLGMVSRITTRDTLEQEALALARRIATSPPVAVSLVKRSINQAQDLMGQRNAWEYHMLVHQVSHATDEQKEIRARMQEAAAKGKVKEFLTATRESKPKS
ncbi:MAG: enoyl-CoA hydratase [Chloroflexi bacterium]|nr:enoyl-CoA hydratase [Chloroflexota bacterium]